MRLFLSVIFLCLLLLGIGAPAEGLTLGPPEPRPSYQPPHKQPDHELYKRIFELRAKGQRNGIEKL